MVTTKVPTDSPAKTIRLEVADLPVGTMIVVWLNEKPRPDGATLAVRRILPVNPFTENSVMVEVAEEAAGAVTTEGRGLMAKSVAATARVTEWERGPFAPVTVTV